MNTEYLVKDYTNKDPKTDKPSIYIVYGNDIFKVLDDAREKGTLVAVYEIGKCVLDWS